MKKYVLILFLHNHIFDSLFSHHCYYLVCKPKWNKLDGLAKIEGKGVRERIDGLSIEQCKAYCDSIESCKSLTYDNVSIVCFLKDKEIDYSAPTKDNKGRFYTYFKVCKGN